MEPLSLGSVISRSFQIFARNLVPFTLLAAIAYSPVLIWLVIFLQGRLTQDGLVTYSLVMLAGGLILSLLATGAITYGVFEQLRGEPAPMGRCLAVGLSRLLPVLGVALLVGICVALGFLALIVPGFILICMLWLAVPVTVVERVGVFESLSRSRHLTNGLKGTIFGIIFVLGIIEWVINFVIEKIFLGGTVSIGTIKAYLLVGALLAVLFTAWRSVANAVAYHDIRTAKEGVGIDELIAVFE